MAALRDLDSRVIGKQRMHPSAQGGSFHAWRAHARAPWALRWSSGRPSAHAECRSTIWRCPEPDLNRYAREGQRGLSSPCLHSTIRAAAPWAVPSAYGPPHRRAARAYPGTSPRTANPQTEVVLFYWQLSAHQRRGGVPVDTGRRRTCPYAGHRADEGNDAISMPPDGGPLLPREEAPGGSYDPSAGRKPEQRRIPGGRAAGTMEGHPREVPQHGPVPPRCGERPVPHDRSPSP